MRESRASSPLPAIAVVAAGIATFSAMDGVIKSAAMVVGVYTALLLRNVFGTLLVLPVWLAGKPTWPRREALALHFLRSAVNTGMAWLFFIGLLRTPMAEAMAISFIAPLIALYLAAAFLKEKVRRSAIIGSLLGLGGVLVIVAGRLGSAAPDPEALTGVLAVLASATLYAVNLVLQRKQATQAGPVEITLFQNLIIALLLSVGAPWLLVSPPPATLAQIGLGAFLAAVALGLLAWGYARAEAQVLVPIEYTGFIWAALFGWLVFDEPVGLATVAGCVLIVTGCWIATRRLAPQHTEQTTA